ncbi:MAG: guanylate kinase [Gemmatimonadota bacterium]|nr:guanylate kinase [Gemmatimonadota bacterium]
MSGVAGPLVLVGPSGAGKTTVANELVSAHPDRFVPSVSVTTRRPRDGERHGRDYLFVSRAEFDEMIRGGRLAEWAEVHGERYGTPADNLREESGDGPVPVLDIDVLGAGRILKRGTGALVIFILPPGPAEWIGRLAGRGTESPREIARRLRTALGELRAVPLFERFVVNAELDRTVRRVLAHWAGEPGGGASASEVAARCRRLEDGARSEIARLEETEDPTTTNAERAPRERE